MVVLPRLRGPLLISAGALGSALVIWAAADRLAAALVRHWQPQLEQSLSRLVAQPVRLGPYRGLRPWGLEVGPSRIEAQADQRSTISIATVRVAVAPLATLRQGLLSLQVDFGPTQVVLRPDNQGRYWRPGPSRPAQALPRLDLRLQWRQPATVVVQPNGRRYGLAAAVQVQPHLQQVVASSSLRPLANRSSGLVSLRGRGQWARQQWQGQLQLQRVALADLIGLLPLRRPPTLPGTLTGAVDLRWQTDRPNCQGQLSATDLPGTGGPLRLRCRGQNLTVAATPLRWGRWRGQASGQARWSGGSQLLIQALEVRSGSSWIRGNGQLGPTPRLLSQWRIRPADLPGSERLPSWIQQAPLQGTLQASGSWRKPLLALTLERRQDPLLGPWRASLRWSTGTLQLLGLRSRHLQASGTLPLQAGPRGGLQGGALQLQVLLQGFPLQRLQPLLGARLGGTLEARGRIGGPLNGLVPDLALGVQGLQAGPLGLDEHWQGRWQGSPGGGGQLTMAAQAPAPSGSLTATVNRSWLPTNVLLRRGDGQLSLSGLPRLYSWQARMLLLNGLSLSLGPRHLAQPLRGQLSGAGELGLQPLGFSGKATLERPALLGLQLQTLVLQGSYRQGRYRFNSSLKTLSQGELTAAGQGLWRGPFAINLQARGLSRDTLQQLADLWPQWQGEGVSNLGQARDLGQLMLDTLGQSLQDQLEALARAHARLAASPRGDAAQGGPISERLRRLQARIDADISLRGPNLQRVNLDLAAKGHLWRPSEDQDLALASEPFVIRLQGPLQQGQGSLSLEQLPLSLLALLTPVPETLRGSLSLTGRYGLGPGGPSLSLQLGLDQARYGPTALELQRGAVALRGNALQLDLALQAEGASSPLELAGVLPLDPEAPQLELRLASRGDGLRFLTRGAEPGFSWQRGSADLQLLLRGSLSDPIANGFLRMRGGQLGFIGQTVQDLEATVVFDFEQLLVQELRARVASGAVSGSGHLGLLNPTATEPPLTVNLTRVPFNLPRIRAIADGNLTISGSLRDLQMGGELGIERGIINAQRGRLAPTRPGQAPAAPRKGVAQLLQEKWDFSSPLLLVGAEVESNSSQDVLEAVPRFSVLGFNDLRLKLGPDLRIVVPNAASFTTAGLLRLSGRLDPTLRARGVVRLLQGRLNLFTTSFSLDPDAPNVAVFTPALGLIPYLDIAMRTRVSDSLAVAGLGSAGTPSLAEIEAQGGLTSLNQLNLVRITVSVSGPADRLAQSLKLRSSPPMPESRLIALIGGNSLAGLSGSGAGAAIATVVGQTLLSPVLGGLSDALGQRVSFALYPTYVNPNVTSDDALQSRRLAPQLVLGSEIGLDVTERFNVSVLAAPNRSDVPPQVNLNLRATDLLNVQGSVDTQGAWQTQLQLFFRF
jgi:translocation and assembly module TamB